MTLTVTETNFPTIDANAAKIKTNTGRTPGRLAARQSKLATNLNNTILSVDSIKLTVENINADLVAVGSVVDDIQANWGTLTAQQVSNSITNNVVAVLGDSSDTTTAATVFGGLADLDAGIVSLPASVSGSVEAGDGQLERRLDGTGGAVSGAQGLASRAARTIVENVRSELDTRGKTETAYELIRQLRTTLNIVKETVTAIPQNLNLEPLDASIREISDLMKQISSENGVTTPDVDELKDKVERLRGKLNLNREIVEKVPRAEGT